MSKWKNIKINTNLIKSKKGKSALISLPLSSAYKDFVMWYPSKLVRYNEYEESASIAYTDDFTFKIKKYDSVRFNRQVVEEKVISVEDFEEAFSFGMEEVPLIHYPERLEPIYTEALEELKDE